MFSAYARRKRAVRTIAGGAMTSSNEPNVLSTTLGDLALQEYHLRLDGRAWRILHTGAILGEEDEQGFLGAEVRALALRSPARPSR
jgi:hypothetical protein